MACVKVELSRQNRKAGATLFAMNKITQTARYRQSLIRYAQKNGVTAAAIRYRTYRQYIYRWMKRYDGTLQSLEDRTHRPHSHPNRHHPEEIKLIDDMRRRNPNAGLELRAMKLSEAAKKVGDSIEETLTYCDFPLEHWTRIRTNNVIERLNREIRRRTLVVGCFPDGNSTLMLVCAQLHHVASTQWGSKKYMNMKHLEALQNDTSLAG